MRQRPRRLLEPSCGAPAEATASAGIQRPDGVFVEPAEWPGDDRRMLTALGATKAEDRVYRYLVTTVSASAGEIAAATRLSAVRLHAALDELRELGLVAPASDGPGRFAAAAPDAVEALIANRLLDLRNARQSLDEIAEKYPADHPLEDAGGVFEVIRGQEALRSHVAALIGSARFEVLNMVKPPIIAVRSDERLVPAEMVRARVIYETHPMESAEVFAAIRSGLREHDEARVHTKLPIKMLAADRVAALVPLAGDTAPLGVMVYPSPLLDAFLALFDCVWATAVRLHLGESAQIEGEDESALCVKDRQLLSLLLSGLTDQAIAAHLQVSTRTVRRRVQILMAWASVRSRMQLAWGAARQGWV